MMQTTRGRDGIVLYDGAASVFLALIWGIFGVVALLLSIPLYYLWGTHRRKMEELRLQRNVSVAQETKTAIEELRREMLALKDTTTQYDMSFDVALQRLESRVGHLEQRTLSGQTADIERPILQNETGRG